MEAEPTRDAVVLLESNLDDMTGEALAYALERLLDAGALDAWFTPIVMKKGRPAVILAVLCRPPDAAALRQVMLRETTTLGVRYRPMEREVAERSTDRVDTPWGPVRRKLKRLDGRTVGIKPEYEDCARLAREHGVPLQDVIDHARAAPADSAA